MSELTMQMKYDICLRLIEFLPVECKEAMDEKTFPEAKYIINAILKDFKNVTASAESSYFIQNKESLQIIVDYNDMLQVLIEKTWERIHIQKFNEVPIKIRKIYAMASLLKIILILINWDKEEIDNILLLECYGLLDKSMMIGYFEDIFPNMDNFITELMHYLDKQLILTDTQRVLVITDKPKNRTFCNNCEINQFCQPTLETFQRECFMPRKPALLLNTIAHWPALHRWKDLNYIMKVAGNRLMPIEIGAQYTHSDWTQNLIRLSEFLIRQFPAEENVASNGNYVEYLAQYELFQHVPELRKDFLIPDYCSLVDDNLQNGSDKDNIDCNGVIDIKAWLGPAGTISPLHFDPKNNLLCQVFGRKHIVLASPEDSEKLYPYPSELLSNTSQVDIDLINYDEFPLTKDVKFYHLTIEAGDCVYIPPKWWHYVRAETPSFSVSFWWN